LFCRFYLSYVSKMTSRPHTESALPENLLPLLNLCWLNEVFQPPGHRPETENKKRLVPVGWEVLFRGLFIIVYSLSSRYREPPNNIHILTKITYAMYAIIKTPTIREIPSVA
jgi:hypothetical protein